MARAVQKVYKCANILFPEKARMIWRLKCEKRNSKAEQNTLWMDGWMDPIVLMEEENIHQR